MNGSQSCDGGTGQCPCKPNVGQRDCSGCLPGLYNQPGQEGCLTCENTSPSTIPLFSAPVLYVCLKCMIYMLPCPSPFHPASTHIACDCDPVGSLGMACDSSGRCSCKRGGGGLKCDSCLPGFFGLENGDECQECGCNTLGATDNQCDASGQCVCREGVEGEKCDRCQVGYFNLTHTGCR